MKKKKDKMISWKRAVSALLATAMVLTAAPQSGMTVHAAEPAMEELLPEAESGENTTTPIETGIGGDTTQPEDEQIDDGSTQSPEENNGQEKSGDGSENGGDVLPEDPGQEENPDDKDNTEPSDTEELGEGTDSGKEQEGDGEDPADIAGDEESVSENTLGAEPMAEDVTLESDTQPEYKGETKKQTDDEGREYTRLYISAFKDDVTGLSDEEIIEILTYYAEQTDQRFECVQLDMRDTGNNDRKIKKDILNAAIDVLKTEAAEGEENPRYWIDYNLSNESGWRNFTLDRPWGCDADIDVNVTMTPAEGLGVKLKFPAVTFPTEHASVNVGGDNMADTLASSLGGTGDNRDYRLFTLASGKPAAYVRSEAEVGYEPKKSEGSEGKEICVGNISALKANTEYLMAFVADDGQLVAGETKQLTKPAGTNVTWKSYTPDIVSIDADGKLSAWDEGEALYSVTYKENIALKTRFYKMMVERKLYRMEFIEDTVTMEPGWREGLQLNFFPSDAGCDQEDPDEIQWEIKEQKPLLSDADSEDSENTSVIAFVMNDEDNITGEIVALNPGEATVKATYVKGRNSSDSPEDTQNEEETITAECKINVKAGIELDEVREEVENLYAVSDCDTTLKDVTLPDGWNWVNEDQSLAPFVGTEGHDFAVECTKEDGRSARFSIWVRMINVKGIVMTSLQPVEGDESEEEPGDDPEEEPVGQSDPDEDTPNMDWVDWIPDSLEKGDELKLSFYYDLENYDEEHDEEAVLKKLQEKYSIEWSSNPKDQLKEVDSAKPDQMTRQYTASILGNPNKAEKKTFTVSLKDTKTNKIVYKTSHTLTVTTKPLIDLEGIIDDKLEGGNPHEECGDDGKLTSLTFTVKMPEVDYNSQRLVFASMDTGILQLNTKNIGVEKGKPIEENGETIETTLVNIPCTQKSTGRVWIKVTAPDEMKSSRLFSVELPDMQPKSVGAATQTINKASTEHTVPIYVSTHEQYPLVKKEDGTPTVSIQEVKIKGDKQDKRDFFELTEITELSGQEAAAILEGEEPDNGGAAGTEPYIGVYGMKLTLKDTTGMKTGDYTVTLKCVVKGRHEGSEPEEQTVNLTVKVTDVKPKVTFKQTKKVNLFYTDAEGAGTLQINTSEEIENVKVALTDYKDKNPSKNADCHYAVYQKTDENGEYEEGVYEIVRKANLGSSFNEKLKKGTLEYTVKGYAGTFQTTFTVATENKAPVIVLSTKSDTLYPNVWYLDSWISMTDKATGDPFVPDRATYYVGKGANRVEEKLTIGAFDDKDNEAQRTKEKEITGGASSNKYGLFVTDDGNIVSRLRSVDEKKGKKTDTMNLELEKNNWSKPVAVSYKLQVNSATPKLALGKATLTLNKNDDVYRGQQERTTLRLKGCGNNVMSEDGSWVFITGQDDKSKAELKGKDSSLVIWYWGERGDVLVRFNDNDIAPGTYKYKISVGNNDVGEYASTVLTLKIVDKTVKQSLKVSAKGSIDVMNREGTFISYTPKISNLTGTVEEGWLDGRDADMFDSHFEDGKLIVKAKGGVTYSTKNTYEVHTMFLVQNEDSRSYEISSANDPKAQPFKIKVKQGKPKLKATTNGNTIYRQRDNRVDIRIEAILGKQEVEIEHVQLLNYTKDLELIPTWIKVEDEGGSGDESGSGGEDGEDMEWSDDYLRNAENYREVIYNPETKSVKIALCDSWKLRDIQKNGTYKVKFAVQYRDKAGDVKAAEVTCPIVVR